MLIVYGDADCIGHSTRWLYQKRYTNRRVPHPTTFAIEDFITRISVAAGRIHDMPGIFQNHRSSQLRRLRPCIPMSFRVVSVFSTHPASLSVW
ncbi:hypothetical protein TNCV_3463681 [Trichonephila clavipes]|nr:hypothetical protein TNCV_3463681 [Trichonephila clavipes]